MSGDPWILFVLRQRIRWIHWAQPKNRGTGQDCSEEVAIFHGGERIEGAGRSLKLNS